mmetsp:Transcript_103099/g.307962  ORF Transcript_103099/g.307962 Transcript_103099/m.307962 type:complete len:306 (+) Transcript_103099:129-1046(+)
MAARNTRCELEHRHRRQNTVGLTMHSRDCSAWPGQKSVGLLLRPALPGLCVHEGDPSPGVADSSPDPLQLRPICNLQDIHDRARIERRDYVGLAAQGQGRRHSRPLQNHVRAGAVLLRYSRQPRRALLHSCGVLAAQVGDRQADGLVAHPGPPRLLLRVLLDAHRPDAGLVVERPAPAVCKPQERHPVRAVPLLGNLEDVARVQALSDPRPVNLRFLAQVHVPAVPSVIAPHAGLQGKEAPGCHLELLVSYPDHGCRLQRGLQPVDAAARAGPLEVPQGLRPCLQDPQGMLRVVELLTHVVEGRP